MATYPTPGVIDLMAEVADHMTTNIPGGSPVVVKALAQYAGSGTNPDASPTIPDERGAMIRLAAQAIARAAYLDSRGG